MSGWLNFNESLNNIKGQITNFASNVLADDEEGNENISSSSYEDLQRICFQKDTEIANLKGVIEDLQNSVKLSTNKNDETSNNWTWTTSVYSENENNTSINFSPETISDLKLHIGKLEKEKHDLVSQLEQLDTENQQNLSELIGIRGELQDENNSLKEQNEKLQNELQQLGNEVKITSVNSGNNASLQMQLEESKKELNVLKSTYNTLQGILEDSKKHFETELIATQEKWEKSESENKIIYCELQKAKEYIKISEIKSREDEENYQKLAFILESYEKQVTTLKDELSKYQINGTSPGSSGELRQQLDSTVEKLKESENINNQLQDELERRKATEALLDKQLKEEMRKTVELKEKYEKQQEKLRSLDEIKKNLVKKYVDILSINGSVDCIVDINLQDDPDASQFNKIIDHIVKTLIEFKERSTSVEKKFVDISHENRNKNMEIEQLKQTLDELNQKITDKTTNMNKLEMEIESLILTNDDLLMEVESYKNSKLQTINETNEENVMVLEKELENANKEIKELKNCKNNSIINATSNNNIELNDKQKDYFALLNDFDNLKIDYNSITTEFEKTEQKLQENIAENKKLKQQYSVDIDAVFSDLSKAKNDFIFLQNRRDELESRIESLENENGRLRNEMKNSIDVKSDLNELKLKLISEKNSRMELEAKLKNVTKNSEENETTLKLQHEMLKNENVELNEKKIALEESLNSVKLSLNEYEKNYIELLKKYEEIIVKSEELNMKINDKENEYLKLEKEKTALAESLNDSTQLASQLQHKEDVILRLQNTIEQYEVERNEVNGIIEKQKEKYETLNKEKTTVINELHEKLTTNEEQRQLLESQLLEVGKSTKTDEENINLQNQVCSLEKQLQELGASRNDLINMVKSKHEENIIYHNEIKRLTDIINVENDKRSQLESQLIQAGNANEEIARKNEQIDKLTDEINFLKDNCDTLTKNLQEEQVKLQQTIANRSEPTEKELNLLKELERLKSHLVKVEDYYTEELVQYEATIGELNRKIDDLEKRETNSNILCTSVSVRANQQVESLQKQLQMVTSEREELRKQISDADDANKKQAAALANLQIVLDQFQKDRENDIQRETGRIQKQITIEKQIQSSLTNEIYNLKLQLEESKQGLQAASRLSDQLQQIKLQNVTLKDEVSQVKNQLTKSEQKIKDLTSQTDGKVEKCLIKNLVIGFLSSGNPNFNKDQVQVLKIISTVLDFNQQDHDKIKLNKPQGSWLGSILAPNSNSPDMSQESLSQAFIKFLEKESKPRIIPNLLNNTNELASPSNISSKKSSPSPSPIVLNEIVLPTFADFGQIRNSSSILKDVLKDNTPS